VIIVVTSWRGTGASTTAFLLAAELSGEHPAWLVEADPAGGVWTGRMDVEPGKVAGLEHIAFGPSGMDQSEQFGEFAHTVGGVRLITAPADPHRAHTCHRPRIAWSTMLHALDGDVVVDAGRHRSGSPVGALWRTADVVVLVTTPEVANVVSTSEWLRAGGRVAADEPGIGDVPCRLAVVEAPGGVTFGEHAIRSDLGEQFGAWLEWEPTTVELMLRGASTTDRRLRRSALLAGVGQLARAVRRSAEVLT
jgi:MinD-like ATPase involved in chromosome partitioning or flagellar assembly